MHRPYFLFAVVALLAAACSDDLTGPKASPPDRASLAVGAVDDGQEVHLHFEGLPDKWWVDVGGSFYTHGILFNSLSAQIVGVEDYPSWGDILPELLGIPQGSTVLFMGAIFGRWDPSVGWPFATERYKFPFIFFDPVEEFSMIIYPENDSDLTCYTAGGRIVGTATAVGAWRGGVNAPLITPYLEQTLRVAGPGIVRCDLEALGGALDDIRFRRSNRDLTIDCVGDLGQNRVTRGKEMRCTAQATSGVLSDVRWRFTDNNGHVTGDSAGASWQGTMVVGGRMEVSAMLDGSPVSADTTLGVQARAWAGLIQYPAGLPGEQIDASRFPTSPVSVGPNGLDQWTPGALGFYEWWLDWRGKFQPIGSGPNKGYWYLKDPPSWATPVVYLSGHLQAGHPFYEAQTGRRPGEGPPPRGYTNWCTKADMDLLRQEVREHEGSASGRRLSHHAFNVQYTSRNDPGPAVEAIVLRPAPTDRFVDVAEAALGAAYSQALEVANNAAVHASANLYTVTCKVH